MLNKYAVQLMALGIVGSLAATAVAEDSALIDALVKKGVLKSAEAEQIRAEAAKSKQSSAGKLNLDSSVKSLTLSGDFRVRYNYTSGANRDSNAGGVGTPLNPGANAPFPAVTGDQTAQGTFYDMRLRLNADYKLSDDFYAGFGLRTQRDARNDNTPIGRSGAMGAGTDYGVGIYRAFLGWHPLDGVELVAGAQSNPFYTTDLVWDVDLNPAGFSQKIDLDKTLGVSGIELSLVSGQFILQDNNENNPFNNGQNQSANRDAFLWQTQLVAGVDLGAAKLTVAPGYLASNGGYVGISGGTSAALTDTNNVQVLLLPGDVSGEVAGIKTKFLWDFAYNLDGGARFNQFTAGTSPKGTDRLAWLLGVRLGENHKQGDFSFQANYRRTGQGALPQNLSDNEIAFGDSRNMAGLKVGAAYSVSDSSYVGLNYLRFERIQSGGGRVGFANGEWLQAEVGVKF
jgi:hypothetical protein